MQGLAEIFFLAASGRIYYYIRGPMRGDIMNLLKYLKKSDWLMLVLAALITAGTDFNNLTLVDEIWLGCIIFWIVLLGVRIYIESRKR